MEETNHVAMPDTTENYASPQAENSQETPLVNPLDELTRDEDHTAVPHPTPTPDTPDDGADDDTAEADYSALGREQLTAALEALLDEGIDAARRHAAAIRNRFNELDREVRRQALDDYLAQGGDREQYDEQPDGTALAFHALYDRYRTMRQQHLEALEAQKQRNLEAKQALGEELRALVDSDEESM